MKCDHRSCFFCAACSVVHCWNCYIPLDDDREVKTVGSVYCYGCLDKEAKANGLPLWVIVGNRTILDDAQFELLTASANDANDEAALARIADAITAAVLYDEGRVTEKSQPADNYIEALWKCEAAWRARCARTGEDVL